MSDPMQGLSGGAAAAAGLGFQSQIGAAFALAMLSEHPVDHALGLGNARPLWLRFETEAPVDDILVATSAGGFIAVQAKTNLELSPKLGSPLSKTVEQFVRHWLICRDGSGSRIWDRPLDPHRDRLVLAVSPSAPRSIRIDLPTALRLRRQPAGPPPSQGQERAIDVFEQCVEAAWKNTTTEPWSAGFVDTLAQLTSVWTFDATGADARWMESAATRLAAPDQTRALLTALFHVCDNWMAQRGGADLPALRQALFQERVQLAALPAYAQDIGVLQAHSAEIAAALSRYESIDRGVGRIRVRRDCQGSVLAAAETGSLLIIGEPGAGKSAVINELGRELRKRGDVVELAVDHYSVDTLDGLRIVLELANDLVKVLNAWDGPTDGWLIIDALDATRGGKGEGAFRNLIERVIALKGRWKVVASIRTFDLRMGRRFRELFPGYPPDPTYLDQDFADVRHVRVPPWSKSEFADLLRQAPELERILADAPSKLRELAEVPFNTRLISELLQQSNNVAQSLRAISNQAGLLRLYWKQRISEHGALAEACLLRVVNSMIDIRALRAPMAAAVQTDPGAVDVLCQQGVLVRVGNDRYVQFRHHILFDYVASRLVLDADAIVAGRSVFPKTAARGLMLAPALSFLLQELWVFASDRARYWTAVAQLVGDHDGDPVLRSAAGRLSAELPETASDTLALAEAVRFGDAKALTVLGHVSAALAVRLEDEPMVLLAPWVSLAGGLESTADRNASVLRFLIHLLISVAKPPQITIETGKVARALLHVAFQSESPAVGAASLIPFVVATYNTDGAASRALLETIFEARRLAEHSWEDVPALCREIGHLAAAAPDFAARVYEFTFGGGADHDKVTRLGDSRILSLTSNARQDYGSALYSLSEFFPKFLRNHPREAVDAFATAVNAYVARAHAPNGAGSEVLEAVVGGRTIRLRPDLSHIWASDPEGPYAQDGVALIAKFTTAIQASAAHDVLQICNELISLELSAVVWSRMFFVAVQRKDDLIDFLWPYAANEALLFLADTRKDALDLLVAGYEKRDLAERAAVEQSAFRLDTSNYNDPERAKAALLNRLFGMIGANRLVTEEARAFLSAASPNAQPINERPFRFSTGWRPVGKFDSIEGLDREAPANAAIMEAIEAASDYFGLDPSRQVNPEVEPAAGMLRLQMISDGLGVTGLHPDLRRYAEGVIGQGCVYLARKRYLVAEEGGPDLAEVFLILLATANHSDSPAVHSDTEANFEKSQSWSSPSPRVEAAEAMLNVCLQRPDLYPRLTADIDRVLDDPHPAVRLQAIGHLVRTWDIDRTAFWDRLGKRLEREANFGVLEGAWDVIRRTLHADHSSAATHLFRSLARFDTTDHEARAATMVADIVAILAVTYANDTASTRLSVWLDDPVLNKEPLHKLAFSLREAAALGLKAGESDQTLVRHRAQSLLHSIVLVANARLSGYDPKTVSDDKVDELRACIELLDVVGMQLYFATGRTNGAEAGITDRGCAIFLDETARTIERIGDHAAPHTVYHLMQLLEILAPFGAARAFELTAHVIGTGGKLGGYQNESLGADLMVRLIGTFLADHKEIFENESRRQALISCLETFMEAGWTAARRLLYRLPELIQ